jgi:hypothetical protein
VCGAGVVICESRLGSILEYLLELAKSDETFRSLLTAPLMQEFARLTPAAVSASAVSNSASASASASASPKAKSSGSAGDSKDGAAARSVRERDLKEGLLQALDAWVKPTFTISPQVVAECFCLYSFLL